MESAFIFQAAREKWSPNFGQCLGGDQGRRLGLYLSVNGEIRQSSRTNLLIFNVQRLIEYASSFYTLHPGGVIMMGTPEGVGPVNSGDVIKATVESLGRLEMFVGSDTDVAQ